MILSTAKYIADQLVRELQPHCDRIQIAGSIRRERSLVKDIEIVCIPKPYEVGLFTSGIAEVVNKWQKVKGELPCKYTQRLIIPGDYGTFYTTSMGLADKETEEEYRKFVECFENTQIKLDLFFATRNNWGLQYAIRTGSAEFSHNVLAKGWVRKGYQSIEGMLHRKDNNRPVAVPDEQTLFRIIGIDYIEPKYREYDKSLDS